VLASTATSSCKDTTERVSDYPNSAMAGARGAVEDSPVNEYRPTVIDDRYMADWLEFGFSELTAYLAKQARFERYLSDREPSDNSGD
jgi:hypothetical protein